MERYTHAPERPSEMAGKDLNAILGGPARPAGSTFDLPSSDSAFSGSDPAPAFGPPPAPAFGPPPAPSFAPPPPPAGFSAPPAPSFAPPPPFAAVPLGQGAIQTATAGQTQSPLPWTAIPTAVLEQVEGGDSEATRVVPYDEDEEEAAHFKHVFEDFLSAKRQCGESTAGLTIDKFLQKLRDNKSALVTKHGCKTVRFSVYVKEGKAALKATPVRD